MQKKQEYPGSSHGKLPGRPAVKRPEVEEDKSRAAAGRHGHEQEPRASAQREVRSLEPPRTASTEKSIGPQTLESGAAPGVTTPAYPCLCPDEKYPITRSVCLGRQGRNFEKCLGCEHLIKERRPRKSDFKEK